MFALRLGSPPTAGHDGVVADDIDPNPSPESAEHATATVADDAATAPSSDPAPTTGGRRRIDRGLLVVSAVIALGLVFVARGLLIGVTGDDRVDLPATVESVVPVPDAEQALAQTNVFVDLAPGYTGVLIIDGVELETVDLSSLQDSLTDPGEQISVPPVTVFEPGNSTLTFTPSAAAEIERFESGIHRVTVVHWPIAEGRERARSFTWQFNVV